MCESFTKILTIYLRYFHLPCFPSCSRQSSLVYFGLPLGCFHGGTRSKLLASYHLAFFPRNYPLSVFGIYRSSQWSHALQGFQIHCSSLSWNIPFSVNEHSLNQRGFIEFYAHQLFLFTIAPTYFLYERIRTKVMRFLWFRCSFRWNAAIYVSIDLNNL